MDLSSGSVWKADSDGRFGTYFFFHPFEGPTSTSFIYEWPVLLRFSIDERVSYFRKVNFRIYNCVNVRTHI